MTKTRADLQQMLVELEQIVPALIAKHTDDPALIAKHTDDETFWLAFSSKANIILSEASTEDFDWLFAKIDHILDSHGVPLTADPAEL